MMYIQRSSGLNLKLRHCYEVFHRKCFAEMCNMQIHMTNCCSDCCIRNHSNVDTALFRKAWECKTYPFSENMISAGFDANFKFQAPWHIEADKNACIGCGQCEPNCPQSIKIARELRKIDEFVENLRQNPLEFKPQEEK